MGFLNPDSGYCTIGGLNCRKDADIIQKDLGYLSGEISFFDDMSGMEYLKFIARMRSMTDFSKMNKLIDFFELNPNGKIKKMSKGMKQKIGLVTSFMHNPGTLILDEPTSGLDPLMQNRFIDLINTEKSEGKTILMSSHSFEEIERTCDRVGIIKSGKFIADSSVSELTKTKHKAYDITFSSLSQLTEFKNETFSIISVNGLTARVSVKGEINSLIKCLSKYDITAIDNVKQNLEDVFMSYYGGAEND